MNRMLGANCECIRGMDSTETLKLMREVGFDSFFSGASTCAGVEKVRKAGDALGMTLTSLHAPFKGINDLWTHGMNYRPLYKRILECIDAAASNGVPVVVVHISSGWFPPELCDIGFARYDELVSYAADKGVKVAFENLRLTGNVAYFADRYRKVENVGFCLDVGHEHCYTKNVTFMDIFGERLLATHIHDNFGISKPYEENTDIHYLPFDGTVDYSKFMAKANQYGYAGPLTLEISNGTKPEYGEMEPIEFLKTAFERLERISKL